MPVGVRLWKKGETIPPDAGERPTKKHSWCQYLTMARTYAADVRPTFLVKAEAFSCLIGRRLGPDEAYRNVSPCCYEH